VSQEEHVWSQVSTKQARVSTTRPCPLRAVHLVPSSCTGIPRRLESRKGNGRRRKIFMSCQRPTVSGRRRGIVQTRLQERIALTVTVREFIGRDDCNNARKHVTWTAKRMSTTTCVCVRVYGIRRLVGCPKASMSTLCLEEEETKRYMRVIWE
jgi:hypothetical protein